MASAADDHLYRSASDRDSDPHIGPNGVLINLLGLSNTQELQAAETTLSELRIIKLGGDPIEGDLDLRHACAVHQFIFQDVYPWAGETRRTDIMKGDTMFHSWRDLDAFFDRIADHLEQSGLTGPTITDEREFCQAAGTFLGMLNHAHPFREGNGRTQRELLRLLARDHGYQLDWSGTSPMAMKHACIAFEEGGNAAPLSKLIQLASSRLPAEQEPLAGIEP